MDDAQILAQNTQKIGRGHAEILAGMVRAVLDTAQVSPEQLDKISVCVGPGSFTGLRVGLSFAKGLALPYNIPIVGLSSLYVWAAQADPDSKFTILAAADIRRGQILTQIFKCGRADGSPRLVQIDRDEPASLQSPQPSIIVGTGAHYVGGVPQDGFVSPAVLAWLGSGKTPNDYPAAPLYHRPPDAKFPKNK